MMFNILRNLVIFFNYLVFFYALTVNSIYFMQLVLSAFSLSDYIKKMLYSDFKKYTASDNMIPISVLVPAYNEEATIVENIESLLSLKYPLFEVVIINDGSKADALNIGINISRYPIFASIDADSILEGDSLIRVMMPFIENKETIAVGGIIRIANGSTIVNGNIKKVNLPKSRIAMFQVVEYLRAFLTGIMGWNSLNSLLIISGAFGAFRKQEVVEVGGYSVGTVGEDMELVMKLHEYMIKNKRTYNVKFLPDPVCWTQAPEKLRDLRTQRRRWQIGLMDTLLCF